MVLAALDPDSARTDTPRVYGLSMILTLDTCVVLAAVNREESHDLASIDQLFELAASGRISIQLTEAFRRDLSRTIKDEATSAARRNWLAESPVMPSPVGGVFRLDVSLLGSNDMLCDKRTETLNDTLIELLGVNRSLADPSKAYSDIDHLLAHAISGADILVTVDERTILNKQEELWRLGLKVLKPGEALHQVTET